MQVSTDADALYPEHVKIVRQRLESALSRAGKHGAVIPSGRLKRTFLDDHHYPFKVNPHFKAWLPVTDVPDSFILIREGEKPTLFYNQPEDYWHKPPADPAGFWISEWDIQTIREARDMHNLLGDPSNLVFIGEEVDQASAWGIGAVNPDEVLNPVHFDRAYKTSYELACMQRANLASVRGHVAAEHTFREGGSEFDIQHAYLATVGARESEAPYSGIIALNENCAVLHYQHYEMRPPADARSMLIDAGADYHGYAADITRTYSAEDNEFAALIARMDEEQLGIIRDINTGDSYVDLHRRMHYRIATVLRDFGIVDMTPESMVESNVTGTFLPHGLGHLLGLQTHDVAGFQQDREGATVAAPENHGALRLTRPIENRQVFTIEPGLYFIPMLLKSLREGEHASAINWSKVETFLPYGGIRIEDNIAMLGDKPVNLTRDAFAAIADD